MRAVEIITVYLACAAPFGVARFVRFPGGVRGCRRIACAAAAGLLWPLVLWSHITTRESSARGIIPMGKNFSPRDAEFGRAERALVEALHRLEDEAVETCGVNNSEPTARSARFARATVSRYAGLTLAARHARAGGEPTPCEIEPARVSGRTGADLEAAGRCLHRRNVARLEAHRRAARVELLHALADLPDTFAASLLARPSDHRASRRLFAALLPVYSRSIALLQLDGDAGGVQALARLFDDSCARLRRLEVFASAGATDAAVAPEGDEQCPPHDPHLTAARLPSPQTQPTALTRA